MTGVLGVAPEMLVAVHVVALCLADLCKIVHV